MNFRAEAAHDVAPDLPGRGAWRLRLDTDWTGYSEAISDHEAHDLDANADAEPGEMGQHRAMLSLGAYSALVYSR